MLTSCGYHTFTVSKNLTQEEVELLVRDFKRYRDKTGKICIIKCPHYSKDPNGRHYEVVYPEQNKGISWRIRFSNIGFWEDGKYKPCSIKATINPKILIGEKSYIQAANESYTSDIVFHFDHEAEKISPILRGFYNYSLNRIDYCINFDVSELKFRCLPELKGELPNRIMQLIKYADVPDNFIEEYEQENQFYLKGKSVVINCYWKYAELKKEFSDCKDLKDSYDIIRFEVQYKYPKVYTMSKYLKKEIEERKSSLINKLNQKECYGMDFCMDHDFEYKRMIEENDKLKEVSRINDNDIQINRSEIMDMILSDERCDEEITKYFNKVIKTGDYYTFAAARKIIMEKTSRWEKTDRLIQTLDLVRNYGGISKVKRTLQGKKLEDFRRSLRELAELGINPVTIPGEWGIENIPNLLANYKKLCREENAKEIIDEILQEYKTFKAWKKSFKKKKTKS